MYFELNVKVWFDCLIIRTSGVCLNTHQLFYCPVRTSLLKLVALTFLPRPEQPFSEREKEKVNEREKDEIFFPVALEFELRASQLLDRCSMP
jgi:hypothetical protein